MLYLCSDNNYLKQMIMSEVEITISLTNIFNNITDENHKSVLRDIIKDRDPLFLIDSSVELTGKEIGRAKLGINKVFNSQLYQLFPYDFELYYDTEFKTELERSTNQTNEDIVYENRLDGFYTDKNKWITKTEEYNNLVILRGQLFRKMDSPFYRVTRDILDLNAKEIFNKLIIKHFKL